jgi:hypothetical protein
MSAKVDRPEKTETDITITLEVDHTSMESSYDPRFTPLAILRDEIPDHEFFKIAAGPAHKKGQPVHENMTLAALIAAGLIDKSMTYEKAYGGFGKVGQQDVWEYIRGVIWNDDPACLLFNESETYNNSFASGATWWTKFEGINWGGMMSNIIQRSHFGDLQWLHAMATERGEAAGETRKCIITWIEVMYRLSVGDGIAETERIDKWLGKYFHDSTSPKGSQTLRELLIGTRTAYPRVMIDRRALGSCFHVIQDSYAVGHCRRLIDNKDDLTKVTFPYSTLGKLKSFLIGSKQKSKRYSNHTA